MPTPFLLPKDLSLNLVFIRIKLIFTHRMFDESLPGHLGYISQFILKEMRMGTSLDAIKNAFPFNIQPVIERLHQSSLLKENILTELGHHYGYCLDCIQDSNFYGWLHWSNDIKILLPDDFCGFTEVGGESDATNQVKPNLKGERPFAALTKQDKISELITFICPGYGLSDSQLKKKDVWTVRVAPAHNQAGEKNVKQCVVFLPAQTACTERGIPFYLPVMERICDYTPVEPWAGYFPFTLSERKVESTRLCLVTGHILENDEDLQYFDSYPKMAWPQESWIRELPTNFDNSAPIEPLMCRDVNIVLKWRCVKLGSDKIMSSFFNTFRNLKIWTPTGVVGRS